MRLKSFKFIGYLCYVSIMSSLLKIKREDLSLTVKEIASVIRVRENFIVAIENEQYDQIPLEVYARGYIKLYATFLDVPYEEAIEPFDRYVALKKGVAEAPAAIHRISQHTPKESAAKFDGPDQTIHHQHEEPEQKHISSGLHKNKNRYRTTLIALTAAALVLALAFVFYQFSESDYISNNTANKISPVKPQPKPSIAVKETGTQEQPASTNANTETPANTATSKPYPALKQAEVIQTPDAAGENKTADDQAPQKRRHVLVISAVEQTGLQLLIDGKETIDIILEPGETRTFNAFRSFSGVVRNSGGVKVTFNGKPLPSGIKGEAMSLNLPQR
jgi:cytoskeleton protein RodZ